MKRTIVTLSGSLRFWDKIQEMSERLELEKGYVVIGMVPHVLDRKLTMEEKALISELHRMKIDLSDALFVVNAGGYIGESTHQEIVYAQSKGKEILYLETAD